MNENMENKLDLLVKWLRILMYVAIVSLINSIVSFLPFVPAALTTWISRGVMVAMIVCMFQLAPVNKRYKKAGILRAVMLGCTVITALQFSSSILNLAASILSIIAVYQEYSAHSELVSETDKKLSGSWHSMFNWSLIAGVVVGMGSTLAVMVVAMLEMDVAQSVAVIVAILSLPQIVIDIVYVRYLKRMLVIVGEGEVQ